MSRRSLVSHVVQSHVRDHMEPGLFLRVEQCGSLSMRLDMNEWSIIVDDRWCPQGIRCREFVPGDAVMNVMARGKCVTERLADLFGEKVRWYIDEVLICRVGDDHPDCLASREMALNCGRWTRRTKHERGELKEAPRYSGAFALSKSNRYA